MGRRGWGLRAGVLLVSALATGSAVLAIGSRGDLDAARDRVEAAWLQARPALDARFGALERAGLATRKRLGNNSGLLVELAETIRAWDGAVRRPVEDQAALANRLEGLAGRLRTMVQATARLRSSPEVAAALTEMDGTDTSAGRGGYNQAVAGYEDVRGGFPRRLVAGVLGYDSRRTLEVPA